MEHPKELNDQPNSEESQSEKSEEFKQFERGLKSIFSLKPDEARRIREHYPEESEPPEEPNS